MLFSYKSLHRVSGLFAIAYFCHRNRLHIENLHQPLKKKGKQPYAINLQTLPGEYRQQSGTETVLPPPREILENGQHAEDGGADRREGFSDTG